MYMKNICCGAIGVLCLLGGEGGAGGEVAGVGEVGFGGEEGGGAAAGFGAVGASCQPVPGMYAAIQVSKMWLISYSISAFLSGTCSRP